METHVHIIIKIRFINKNFDPKLSVIDRFFCRAIKSFQAIGGIEGVVLLGFYFFQPNEASIGVLPIVLTLLFSLGHVFIPFIKNLHRWLLISIGSFIVQSVFYSTSHFLYSVTNGIGVDILFPLSDHKGISQTINFSSVIIGRPVGATPAFESWGLNVISIFLMLYLVYILLHYYVEKPKHAAK